MTAKGDGAHHPPPLDESTRSGDRLGGRWLPAVVFLAVAVTVFGTQNHHVGFADDTDGWVSAHVLAQIAKASPENGFVGHALTRCDARGHVSWDYFDRYPVFFSAAMYQLLRGTPRSLADQVFLGRQVMNAVFLATLFASYLLLLTLTQRPLLSLAAACFTFSGFYLVAFRDMIHFDQPALLGFVLLLWAIARHRLYGRRWGAWLMAPLAVSLGRGYASLAVLATWLLVETALALRAEGFALRAGWKRVWRHDSWKILGVAVLFAAMLLAYNIHVEADRRGVDYDEVSIVQSAKERLGFDGRFNAVHAERRGWGAFAMNQALRTARSLKPYWIKLPVEALKRHRYALLLVLLPVALLLLGFLRGQSPGRRATYVLVALAGYLWTFPMRNLTAFHDYTSMFFVGFGLVFFTACLSRLAGRGIVVGLFLAVVCLVASVISHNRDRGEAAEVPNAITADFDTILRRLQPGDVVHVDGGEQALLDGVPYAAGFYLADQILGPVSRARYVISRHPDAGGVALTPDNRFVFLFERRPAPGGER